MTNVYMSYIETARTMTIAGLHTDGILSRLDCFVVNIQNLKFRYTIINDIHVK